NRKDVTRLLRLALLLFGTLAIGAAEARGVVSTLGAPPLPVIPEISSRGGVATLALRAALDSAGRPAFFWQGQEVAPTIRVRPGDTIRVHFRNDLPEFCGLGMVSESNLHFHGLEVAPLVPGDEVISTKVAPRRSFDYVVHVGRDQPPG